MNQAEKEWLQERWLTPWLPENKEAQDDPIPQMEHTPRKNEPTENGDQENLCRSTLEDLEEALAEEQVRMREAYRRAGL